MGQRKGACIWVYIQGKCPLYPLRNRDLSLEIGGKSLGPCRLLYRCVKYGCFMGGQQKYYKWHQRNDI